MTRDEKIKDIMKYLKFNPYVEGQQRVDIEDMLEQMHEWTKKQMIKRACKQFKILINFFDSNKEFNADKFCEEWKKDIEEEL